MADDTAAIIGTYRLQLQPGFGFDEAAGIAAYLRRLGISHVYCSPYLQAAPGSAHGYDVVDPRRVNRELGGEAGHARFLGALRQHGLGQVLDIVPNHMAISGRDNRWWWDILENGPASRYASYFDVDWRPPEARLRNTVLMPVLGDHYGRALESGEIRLHRDGEAFTIRYHDHTLPVSPRTLDTVLGRAAERCASDELAFIADALGAIPLATATDPWDTRRRYRDTRILRGYLAHLFRKSPEIAAAVDAAVADFNASPDLLDALLDRQNYRLAHWRTADRELDYRRFFDINTLVGLRAEDEHVFAETHALVLEWVDAGVLDGVRIDHIDGLRDPLGYLTRLRESAPAAWITVEKVLQPGELLPDNWPVAGTTGYDFLNRAGGLFVDPEGEPGLTHVYVDFTGEPADYPALVREKKRQVMRDSLAADLNRLTALFLEICERQRRHRDYTRHQLHEALREVIACFPVYRTYARTDDGTVRPEDAAYIEAAIAMAGEQQPEIDRELLEFLRSLLLLRVRGSLEDELVMRFQQLTGPVMAKGVEDTAFYCFHRLVSLNEVGGDPGRFGTSPEEFHQACSATQEHWPGSMLATSTHDTKRSEDVRARLNLLSEMPDAWEEAVRRWAGINEVHRRNGLPDRNTEYLIYQTLVGAWPIDAARLTEYLQKAVREAKLHTSWTHVQESYEEAVRSFAEALLEDGAFISDLQRFVEPLVLPGRVNSLAQTLLKLTAPGVPDIYQGSELWDLSLVDPDNRRPVDYALRLRLLEEIEHMGVDEAWKRVDEGLPKLWLVRHALAARRRRPDLFSPGSAYRPLAAAGARARHALCFARGDAAITVVPRLVLGLAERWEETTLDLPQGRWRNELSGEEWGQGPTPLRVLLQRFPVALLTRDP